MQVEVAQPLSALRLDFPDLYIGKTQLNNVGNSFSFFTAWWPCDSSYWIIGCYRKSRSGPLVITLLGKVYTYKIVLCHFRTTEKAVNWTYLPLTCFSVNFRTKGKCSWQLKHLWRSFIQVHFPEPIRVKIWYSSGSVLFHCYIAGKIQTQEAKIRFLSSSSYNDFGVGITVERTWMQCRLTTPLPDKDRGLKRPKNKKKQKTKKRSK